MPWKPSRAYFRSNRTFMELKSAKMDDAEGAVLVLIVPLWN